MRKIVVNTFVSLDGVMQAPGGPGEDPSQRLRARGWSVNYWDDLMGKQMGDLMGKPFDLLLGRKTYEIFAAHWPRGGGVPAGLRLANSNTSTTGVIMATYEPAGPVITGSFALEQPSE